MKKLLFLMVSIFVLMTLGVVGSYLYFSNFSKHTPIGQPSLPQGFSR